MNLALDKVETIHENLSETVSLSASAEMKRDLDILKRRCGSKKVCAKLRELIQNLLDENQDKLDKAS